MQDLLQEAKNLKLDRKKDQHFLVSEEVIKNIAKEANLSKEDTVLEIGVGTGNLTKELAKHAGKVVAIEYDEKFKEQLNSLPSNVEIIFDSATKTKLVRQGGKKWKEKECNKIVSSPPYSILEWLLHNIAFVKYDLILLVVPEKFFHTVEKSCIYRSFFNPEVLFKIPKDNFYPTPSNDSVLMKLVRLPDAIETKNLALFLRQYIYQSEDRKVKNTLREGLIKWEKLINNRQMTKKEAKGIVESKDFSPQLLERVPDNCEIYEEVGERFTP